MTLQDSPNKRSRVMAIKKISAEKARKIAESIGIDISDEQRTFYATDDGETEVWSFDTKAERDSFVSRNN